MSDCKCNSLNGVCCSVESCKYHSAGNACTASQINVKDEKASAKKETFCGTYSPSWN